MYKRLVYLATAGIVSIGFAGAADAGFIASTGPDTYTYTAPGSAGAPAIGGIIAVSNDPLDSYTPDTPADPQIAPGDVSNFLFSTSLTITNVDPGSGAVQTAGTYSLYYDLGSNGTPDILVSAGTASLFMVPAFSGFYAVTGQLTQSVGPADPAFADLAYGNNANVVLQGGYYDAVGGQLALSLRQNAIVPEPVSLGTLATAGALMLVRRRRNA